MQARIRLLSRHDIGMNPNIWFLSSGDAEHVDHDCKLPNFIFGQTLNVYTDKYLDKFYYRYGSDKITIEPWMVDKVLKEEKEVLKIEEILDKWE